MKNLLAVKNYKVFSDGRPNIIGIRTNAVVNIYCDRIWAFWNDGGTEQVHFYTVTTNPGLYYLQKTDCRYKRHCHIGAGAIYRLLDNWYAPGQAEALVQQGRPVTVFRDNNKDGKLDMKPETIQKGYFGINLHHGALTDTDIINSHSAGCQVWRYHEPHQELIKEFKALSKKYNFSRFSYTLANQADFA